jgi:hypothetical protein
VVADREPAAFDFGDNQRDAIRHEIDPYNEFTPAAG